MFYPLKLPYKKVPVCRVINLGLKISINIKINNFLQRSTSQPNTTRNSKHWLFGFVIVAGFIKMLERIHRVAYFFI